MNPKLLAATAALSLLLVAMLFVALQYEQRRHSTVMQQQLRSKAAELDRRLTQIAVVPRLLADHPDISNALLQLTSLTAQQANRVLQNAQTDSNAEFAFLLDPAGTTIAASNFQSEMSFVGRNYGFRPYFTSALQNRETTFFAVGATTGIPGYFVANPVTDAGNVIGVVVVKFELGGLLDVWQLEPYEWLATDEFGVTILSTVSELLYLPTSELAEEVKAQIARQRKYVLAENAHFEFLDDKGVLDRSQQTDSFLLQSQQATVEAWQLVLLIDMRRVWLRALLYVVAATALLVIVGLIYRNLRAQQRLTASEKRYAMALELEVQQRTQELRSAQESLISESNFAMLGRMSAAINHEINQPLASLRLNLASMRKLIDQPDADVGEIRQIVVDTDRTTKRIGRVVTTLRNLTSQRRAQHGEVPLQALINDVVETIKRERPTVSASLSVRVESTVSRLPGNEVLLQQALLNLLYNAFDAVINVDDPQVELAVMSDSNAVTMHVTDNGCGVSESVADSLFKPFVSDNRKETGLGLGLTLVELIAKDHGGTLSYQSATYQGGSVFSISLPLKRSVDTDV
ncbi:MAG: ATP-binding protein [Pseudomonadota bacterium]